MVRLFDAALVESSGMSTPVDAPSVTPMDVPRGWYYPTRAIIDFVIALTLLIIVAPVIVVAYLMVRLTSRGPAFYSQTRLGQFGRHFTIYKLRSMYERCETQSGPLWSTKGDPRITPVGRIIRRTHIDELPQLWNILCGDMSLIGPRPERPEFLEKLENTVPRYRERLRVRPGITGLAQVQLPADSEVEDVVRKQAYDLYFIDSMSPWLDLRIILSTPLKICNVPYSVLGWLFRFPGEAVVQAAYLGNTQAEFTEPSIPAENDYLTQPAAQSLEPAAQAQPI